MNNADSYSKHLAALTRRSGMALSALPESVCRTKLLRLNEATKAMRGRSHASAVEEMEQWKSK